jgi:hypothetical protein
MVAGASLYSFITWWLVPSLKHLITLVVLTHLSLVGKRGRIHPWLESEEEAN